MIELLLVLLLVGVLASLAAPSLAGFSQRWHARRVCEQLIQALESTRLQAMIQQRKLVLCGGTSAEKCHLAWEDGWSQHTVSGRRLAQWPLEGRHGRLHYRFFPRGRTALVFLPSGWPEVENGTFWYCPDRWQWPAFAVRLDRYGNLRIEQPLSEAVAREDRLKCV